MTVTSSTPPRVHEGPKITALAAFITILCVALYLAVVSVSGDDSFLRAFIFVGALVVWLGSIAAITLRARVSALWPIGGMIIGVAFTPITVITYLTIYVAFGGDFVMD